MVNIIFIYGHMSLNYVSDKLNISDLKRESEPNDK